MQNGSEGHSDELVIKIKEGIFKNLDAEHNLLLCSTNLC